MKVKVGNRVYDGNEVPVMVILSKEDKANLAAMHPDSSKYCSYPDGRDPEEIKRWMDEL